MGQSRHQLLERYLDRDLDPAATAEFERLLERDAALHAEAEAQVRINTALNHLFEPPERGIDLRANGQDLPRRTASSPAPGGPTIVRRWAGWIRHRPAIAAVFLAALLIPVWMIVQPWILGQRSVQAPRHRPATFAAVYGDRLARGFKPDWVCPLGPEFAMAVYWRLDQTLLLKDVPGDIRVLGWTYCDSMTPETMALLTRVADRPVLVFVDRAESDPGPPALGTGDLHLYRRRVGDLVLYEVSPLDRAHVLEFFYEPELIEEWKRIVPYP